MNLRLTDLEVWGEPRGPGTHTSAEVPMLIPQALGGKALGAGHRPLRRGAAWLVWPHLRVMVTLVWECEKTQGIGTNYSWKPLG